MSCPFGHDKKTPVTVAACPLSTDKPSVPYKPEKRAYRRAAGIARHLSGDVSRNDTSMQEVTSESTDAFLHRTPGAKPFDSMPGVRHEDMESLRTGNHWYINDMHERYGDIFRLQREGQTVVFVRDAESVRKVLLDEDDFNKTFDAEAVSTNFLQYLMNIMQPLLKEAQTFSDGDNAAERAVLRKCFMSSQEFLPGFAVAIDRALERWPNEGRFDVLMASHLLTFEAVMVIIMGENTSYTQAFYDESTTVLKFYEQQYSQPMFDMKLNAQDDEVMGRLQAKGLEVVREFKRRYAAGTQVREGESTEIFDRCMLKLLIDNSSMSDEEICATMINTLLAASEGPAAGIALTLSELMRNKAVQDQLAAEVCAGEDRDSMRFDTLPYLTGTTLEGLRLFSPVTMVQRCAIQNTVVNGYMVPSGTLMAVCAAAVHRDEEQFENPLVFDPNRHGLNYQLLDHERCFMTFSGGPRGCPGKNLAVCIIKQALAKVVEKYELEYAEQPTDIPGKVFKFVEWNVGGLFVNLKLR